MNAIASGYDYPCEWVECTTEVKKSRFITRLGPVYNKEQAMAALDDARRDHPEARHHCSAYLIGAPHAAQLAAMDDDGEPAGTAGKPIFNVISHKQVGDVAVVVIRYFGGIKLGAGGLVRAYAAATQAAFQQARFCRKTPQASVEINCDFAQESALRHWFLAHQGELQTVTYGQQVRMQAVLPSQALPALKERGRALGFAIRVTD